MSTTVDRSPARLSAVLGTGFAVFAVLALAVSGPLLAVVPGAVGATAVAIGVHRGSRTAITLGGAGLLTGTAIGGALGARPTAVLIIAVAVVLAWDAGQNAVTVGERLGRASGTARIETVHLAATAVVASLAAGSGSIVARASLGSGSPVALVVLLVAAIALTAGLRSRGLD